MTSAVNPGQRVVPAEAWLLDNFYLIEQQITIARQHLPRGYSRQLPRLSSGHSTGLPRIYDVALELISHMDGRLDNENTSQFIASYQNACPLEMGELWAFPIMLQLALLENLRRIAQCIARRRLELDAASTWADRMLTAAEKEPKQLIQLLAKFADADIPLTAPFVEEFYARLQAQGQVMAFVQTWVEQKLHEQGVTATQLSAVAGRTAAANQISIANSIGSLRFIAAKNWSDYVESLSVVEHTLREDPAGMHAEQDFATRDRYRHIIEDLARRSELSELSVSLRAIELAKTAAKSFGTEDRRSHVGFYLIDHGQKILAQAINCRFSWRFLASQLNNNYRLALYLAAILFITGLSASLLLAPFNGFRPTDFRFWIILIPGMIAASTLSVSLVNLLVTLLLPPKALPRMDFSNGLPAIHRTMAIVPTLLDTNHEIDNILEALEIRYLGNRDPHLFFALLTDFHDAAEQTQPKDESLLQYARTAVQTLNETYKEDRPCIFYLFHRPRVWNSYEQVWMGYERKRGKLQQFNAFLRGEAQTSFSEIVGDTSILASIKYVITLDTDTQLPRDAARSLIGNIAHPLNRPVYDADKGLVVDGYTILQPRASISLTSAGRSIFTKLFAGESGIDPYTREVSDVYQDIFGEGTFIGKGIYDVDFFRLAVDNRFPENLILSHDLLESAYARSALVTDVDLIEEHPASYTIESSRRHRWIRGDWQIAYWLLPRVPGPDNTSESNARWTKNPLTALSVWKIFDNLRRSLVPASFFALLTMGWLLGPGPAWFWSLLVVSAIIFPALLTSGIELLRKPDLRDWHAHLIMTIKSAGIPVGLALLNLIILPYDTFIYLDAILRSGLRMIFTRRKLLLWQLPSYARRNSCLTIADFIKEIWLAPFLAIIIALALQGNLLELSSCAPILFLWLVSPVIIWWISNPLVPRKPDLTVEQQEFLRSAARRTWRFFSEFVGPKDNWLPPDNFQEYPDPIIASRTSPTNIGMALLANLSAHDFGYISTGNFLKLTEKTLESMECLERYRGHFYNWYDTRSLKPLQPQYISSVDSGNLAGSLLTLQAGLSEIKKQPVLSANAFQGLKDTLRVLAEQIPATGFEDLARQVRFLQNTLHSRTLDWKPLSLSAAAVLLAEIQNGSGGLVAWLPMNTGEKDEIYSWAQSFDQQTNALQDDIKTIVPDPQRYSTIPELGTLTTSSAQTRLKIIDNLIDRCRKLAEMDFEFLYDTSRHLLAIGYDVSERRRDPSCYDLLASESRLASFLLIAKGQIPQKHWFLLGRLLTSQSGDVSLISWSGSMFEYLMPQLIMPSFQNTLLDQTCKAAVSRQIDYGRQRAVPWGISESCYNATDMHKVYQYRAFGVPGLGFKRGLGDDLVIAPYASALALTVIPLEACRNLQTLADNGLLGSYGFYEAVDYTPSRIPHGKTHAIVRNFMAHHQGMSLLAFAYVLLNKPMQRRFMSDPLVRSAELLLQERVPKKGAPLHPHSAEVNAAAHPPDDEAESMMRIFTDPNTPIPEVHLLSNGSYHVMASNGGGGYSRWHDIAITRWREDATSDGWGTFIYLRDRETGHYWSTAHQPTQCKADHYEAIFVQARAEYRRRDKGIEAHTEISISPEDDVEIRRVKLTNMSHNTRHIETTSFAEIVLAPLNTDLAHRAFSNLFVQTEILPAHQAILCTRRRRNPDEQVVWMFHLFASPGVITDEPSYETDRSRFIGRGRTAINPIIMDMNNGTSRLSNTDGSVLDPIVAIRRTITLLPDESATVQILTGVAETREAALALLEKYCDRHFTERSFEMAWFQSQEVLRHLDASEADAQIYGRLANSVIYSNALRRAASNIISRNQLGQAGLWRFGISGDLPIVLLRVSELNRINSVKQALQAHAYWRMKGLVSDLVIINEDFSGYRAVLHDLIMGLINAGPEAHIIDKPGGVFVRRAEELSEEDRVLFQTVARIVFNDTFVPLTVPTGHHVPKDRISDSFEQLRQPAAEKIYPLSSRQRIFFNGLGGFTPDGHEYVITLEPGQQTPAPWVNVIASPHIGTVVSESGSAFTWVENAHEFRLTTWHNDPLSDSTGESFYIRDEESGAFWSPTPLPARGLSGYVCRHGFGYSVFEHYQSEISSELTTYVAMDAPVKFVVIKLRNHSERPRRLSLTGFWELVLGEWRHENMMHIVTETDPHSGAIFARNAYGRECANRVVFLQVSELKRSVSGNRTEFLGRNGSMADPAALHRKSLSNRTGAGYDPCAAMQTMFELAVGQEREIVFIFGAAKSSEEARHFIGQLSGPAGARQALEAVWEYWNHTLGAVQVDTPDQALNILTNGWLLYQTLSSRIWGRSGYYQSGGAFGFRDQLQDTMALIHAAPWLAREQLIRCAERQFIQGDVQHWWHPPHGQGVRTHFSDDYLWLPYVTCHYVKATGDTGVLDESIHFIEGRELNLKEEAYYDLPQRSIEKASLYEHCVRSIKHGLRFGDHQLPLMGCGDWNDGMNRVGLNGKGESVWLGWFLYDNLQQFADLARSRNDMVFSNICAEHAVKLSSSVEANAWDGGWYRRAYFDDGTPLGSASNDECQIDSVSQSWAVISGGGNLSRTHQAMESVEKRLVRRDAKLIQLLEPPFDKSNLEPGYIKGYVPGVRENGGQYTHAAIWASMAFAMLGEKDRAWELFSMLNPINHGSAPEDMKRYKVEPYVMCADIYGAPPHTSRGGWTWYTGAAGWMYRLTLETLLGLHLEGNNLRITPCIQAHWQSYKIHYRYRETVYHITVTHLEEKPENMISITLDGRKLNGDGKSDMIPLIDDQQEHYVEVFLE